MTTIVGLTGGIASGKSTILNFIKRRKIPTHDSDFVVTYLYKNHSKEFINLLENIGLKKSIKLKKINKKIVKELVLSNRRKLKMLEKFIHQKVKLSRDRFIFKNKNLNKKLIILDIPLLFEKKLERICDYVLFANCPHKIRIVRALRRKNVNKKNLEQIINLQISNNIKKNKSDFVINTTASKDYTYTQTLKALKKIKKLNNL